MCHRVGCDGNHAGYVHPAHHCRPPSPHARSWTCSCGKEWEPTRHGWRLVDGPDTPQTR